jgi:hypothetical protein
VPLGSARSLILNVNKYKNIDGLFTLKYEHKLFIDIVKCVCSSAERRLRVLENRVLRRIFGPKRDEVTGDWRKLHKKTLIICTPHPILFG